MRTLLLALFALIFCSFIPKPDSTVKTTRDTARFAADTTVVKVLPDSISALIRMPNAARHDQFIDTLLKRYAFNPYLFHDPSARQKQFKSGTQRPARDPWIVGVILALLVYTGILNRVLGKDIFNVIQAFYLKTSLAKLNREDNVLTSWAFICLFVLFGLTIGLYVYQVSIYNNVSYNLSGFQLFMATSLIVIAVFLLKIMLLRVLGFIFDIGPIIREYVSILYLTYFNIAFIFLPVVICFSLFSSALMPSLLTVSEVFIVIIVLIQYIRSVFNIISVFSFHKIYLFIYLCALEICPILIVVKALNL